MYYDDFEIETDVSAESNDVSESDTSNSETGNLSDLDRLTEIVISISNNLSETRDNQYDENNYLEELIDLIIELKEDEVIENELSDINESLFEITELITLLTDFLIPEEEEEENDIEIEIESEDLEDELLITLKNINSNLETSIELQENISESLLLMEQTSMVNYLFMMILPASALLYFIYSLLKKITGSFR